MRSDREYVSIRISIDTGYKWGEGLERCKTDEFYREATFFLEKHGWVVNVPSGWSCPEPRRGQERLYVHPMEVTGDVLPETVGELETIFSSMKTARLLGTKYCGAVKEWDDEGYEEWLNENREKIRSEVLSVCKTKRRNLYVRNGWALYERVGQKFSVPRVGHSHCGYSSSDPEFVFAKKMVDELIDEGKLLTMEKDGLGYVRTA